MKKYVNITKDSIVNQNDKVKRINPYEETEYYVIGWDESIQNYRLRDESDKLGINVLASPDELINNFQIEIEEG